MVTVGRHQQGLGGVRPESEAAKGLEMKGRKLPSTPPKCSMQPGLRTWRTVTLCPVKKKGVTGESRSTQARTGSRDPTCTPTTTTGTYVRALHSYRKLIQSVLVMN